MVSLAARLTWQRLYDRRAGCSPVQSFYDHIDTESAIYSLVSFGQECFLAGSANSRPKIFDFRSSSKVYHYTDGLECFDLAPHPEPITPVFLSSSYTLVEDCHHDFRTDTVKNLPLPRAIQDGHLSSQHNHIPLWRASPS